MGALPRLTRKTKQRKMRTIGIFFAAVLLVAASAEMYETVEDVPEDAFETTLSTTSLLLQKSSMKEVKAKHAAANKADNAAHKAADAKTGKLHKGLVKAVVSDKSTKHAKAAAGANGKAAAAAAAVEKKWAKKEAGFRAKARALNKKQRAAAKSMEGGVKSARKALMADTAKSIKEMHEAAVAEKKLMKKHAAFQKKMQGIQKAMAHESAAAKAASGRRLAKMQITAMPVYKNSGANGRFKANRGAGSVCTMVKSLAAGMSSGDDGGI